MVKKLHSHWRDATALLAVAGSVALLLDAGLGAPARAEVPIRSDEALVYVPVDPCRIVKTDSSVGGNLVANTTQTFLAFGDETNLANQGGNTTAPGCPNPKADEGRLPVAMVANVTAVGNQAAANGNIVAFAAQGQIPSASLVNFTPTANVANSTIVPLCVSGCPNGKQLALQATQNVPAIVDVQGYFYRQTPRNVVTVSPAGGDFTTVKAALDAITDADSNNRYVIKIGPGEYANATTGTGATESILTKSFVDIEGAGRCATTLKGVGGGGQFNSPTIIGTGNSTLRDLCIVSDTSGTSNSIATGLLAVIAEGMVIERVTVQATSDAVRATAVEVLFATDVLATNLSTTTTGSAQTLVGISVLNDGRLFVVHGDVTIAASGSGTIAAYGVRVLNATLTGGNLSVGVVGNGGVVDATALDLVVAQGEVWSSLFEANRGGGTGDSFGVRFDQRSTILVRESELVGETNALVIDNSSPGARIVNSRLRGTLFDGDPGTQNCLNNYLDNLASTGC